MKFWIGGWGAGVEVLGAASVAAGAGVAVVVVVALLAPLWIAGCLAGLEALRKRNDDEG